MKKMYPFLMFCVAFLYIQCTGSDTNSKPENRIITQGMLEAKKAEVLNLINKSSCSGSCNAIAFGRKPCGGPRTYLPFSSSVNLAQLEKLVAEYNEMEHQFNIQTNAASDCAFVLPPNTIKCVNGTCVIIN